MKISVISPTYNNESVIARTVSSVLWQTHNDLEHIVIDDCSTDNTRAILSKFTDPRLKVVSLTKNSGVHIARNMGLKLATGDYVLYLDGDDELLPDCLQVFKDTALEHNDAGIISCPYITNTGELTGLNLNESQYVSYEDLICLKYIRRLKPGLAMIQSELAKRYTFKAPNVDFIYYRYVMRNAKLFYISTPYAVYHLQDNPEALHLSRRKLNLDKSIMRAPAIDDFLIDFKPDYTTHSPQIFAGMAYGAAVGLLLGGQKRRAIIRAFEAAYYSRGKVKYLVFLVFTLIPLSAICLRAVFNISARMR